MKWCEIFRTGRCRDSKGNIREWTETDLKEICANFETKNPDVPICVGHPKTNSPAYGWIDKLKNEGGKLYASFKDVQPEFQEAVKKGLFKTRSISLTKDLIPRHIAFLGAQAPAIKGMEQFCFEAETENDIVIDFSDNSNNDRPDLNSDKGGSGSNEGVPPFVNKANVNDNTESEQSEPNAEGGAPSALEREGVDVLNNDQIGGSTNMPPATPPIIKGENMDLEKQLNEKDAEIAALRKELEEAQQDSLKKEFEDFCDNAIKEGNILPSQKNDVINILTACANSAMNFSDSEGNEKGAGEMFKTFVNGLKQMDFEEIANHDNADEAKSINFNDANEVAMSIQALQKDYAEKGIELSPVNALEKLKRGK